MECNAGNGCEQTFALVPWRFANAFVDPRSLQTRDIRLRRALVRLMQQVGLFPSVHERLCVPANWDSHATPFFSTAW